MAIKEINCKYLKLLILLGFCISSATIGGPLIYGPNIHLGHHSVHIHHDKADQCLDEEDHSGNNIALYFDYLTVAPSSHITIHPADNFCLPVYLPPSYGSIFFDISSRIICNSSINRFCLTNLYQHNSSYII